VPRLNRGVGPHYLGVTVFKKIAGIVALLIGLVWIVGAIGAGFYYNFDHKRQCIDDEGWFKGWMFCSTETRSSFAVNMIRGAFWPIAVLSTSASTPAPSITREEFNNSVLGTMYICWSLALDTERTTDSGAIAQTISWIRRQDGMPDDHGDYMVMGGVVLQELNGRGDAGDFYQRMCEAPVSKMKQAITDGMVR
jgi:hypothetical protein